MAIQWYPGHMHKARKQLAEVLPRIDVLIELRDARIPASSSNPSLADLRGEKPVLVVFTKTDLADPAMTAVWQQACEDRGESVLLLGLDTRRNADTLPERVRALLGERRRDVPVTIAMVGIPNVGKSTLINHLAGRRIARTGDEPAVTQRQQRVTLNAGLSLLDTPGLLWGNIDNHASGYRLAATGAIKNTAIDHTEVALFAIEALHALYPGRLAERYGLNPAATPPVETLEAVGAKRGCLVRGGGVHLERAASVVLADLRSGALGQLTLETPEMLAREREETAERNAEREAKRQARLARRKPKRPK
ncbi:MAG: ribosome biogenesis GTPase YlqF [Pseudomonadota bacterium]